MGDWRRQRGKGNHQEMRGTRTRSQNWKPPKADWKPTVPAWEKNFCTSVCSIPWWKVLEAKKFMYLFENVAQWNDSAGEEAFKNAKTRFWAQINDLPCNISLPDPDIYIDKIDWDAEIDPQLLLDLECNPAVREETPKDQNAVILDYSLLPRHLMGIGCGTGWGDLDDYDDDNNNVEKKTELCDWNAGDQEYSRKQNYDSREDAMKNNGWKYHSWERNQNNFHCTNGGYANGGNWGKSHWNWRKREGFDGYAPINHKTSGFSEADNTVDCGWRNEQGRERRNFRTNNRLWTESY